MSQIEEQPLAHDYDGIREYDNPLPRWWVYLFIGTIVFAVVYYPYYHFGGGQLPTAAWQADMDEWNRLHPPVPLPDEAELVSLAQQSGIVERGREIFATRCVSCHAPDGGGQVGPNLTDDYSIHGWTRATMARVVHDGVPAKGMIAWRHQLSREDILAVALFAYSLRGTKPLSPKAAEGDPIAPAPGEPDGALGAP